MAKWKAGLSGIMPMSSKSLAPGIYIEELTRLPHPIECVSTRRVGLLGVTSRAVAPVAITGFGKAPRALGNQASEHIPLARGTNLLRFFPVQGNQIWGARTTSQDPEWQYINVRRLVVYIEQSISQGLQWAVFENNGPALWAAVRSTLEGFLTNLWQSGSLRGNKRQDAFFVRCDNTTMTQNDIDSGRLVSIVGFAPIFPAEFVVLQITGQTEKKK
jgi:phage tail sheath protein FI